MPAFHRLSKSVNSEYNFFSDYLIITTNKKAGYNMQISPMYLGDADLLAAQEINRQQKQFRKYYEFELNPEESATLEIHYRWKGFNVEPGDEETTRVLINLVVERLNQNLVGKPFDLKTIVKEVQRF